MAGKFASGKRKAFRNSVQRFCEKDARYKDERFFLVGAEFNIQTAAFYAQFHQPVEVEVNKWVEAFGVQHVWNVDEDTREGLAHDVSLIGVDRQKAERITDDQLDDPIFIGFISGSDTEHPMVFDGWHRLAKAYKIKRKTIKAIIFSPLETLHIMGCLKV